MFLRRCWSLLLFLAPFLTPFAFGEQATGTQSRTYVVAYRTPAHQRYSTLDVFDDAVTQLNDYFQAKQVAFLVDSQHGIVSTQNSMPMESMLALAKGAGANVLLLLTVDRPKSQWIKVTVQAIDLSGKTLWQESASDMWRMTGKSGLQRTMNSLHAKLDPRIGGPGLPTSPEQVVASAKIPVTHYGAVAADCIAQTTQTAAPTQATSEPINITLLLKRDTELPLQLAETITNKKTYIGSMIGLSLVEDLVVQGYIVAAKGACAVGRITQGKEIKGMQPGSGLQFELMYMKAGNVKVPLAGAMTTEGHRDKGTIIASTVVFGLSGLLSTVNSAKTFDIPQGTSLMGYVAEDTHVYPMR